MPKIIEADFSVNRHPRTIAVVSGKGGVGKSNIAANLAIAVGQKKRSVMLLDADLGLANADVVLGVRSRGNIGEVIAGQKSLNEIITQAPGGVALVPACSGIASMADLPQKELAQIIDAFSHLEQTVDTLIVDVAAGINAGVVRFSKSVQEVVVVVCDEPSSITDAYALIKVLNTRHKISRFQLVTNMSHSESQGHALYRKVLAATDRYLDVVVNHLGNIPFDDHLRAAVNRRVPVLLHAPHSSSAKAFRRLADQIETLPRKCGTTGDVQFFLKQVVGHDMRHG